MSGLINSVTSKSGIVGRTAQISCVDQWRIVLSFAGATSVAAITGNVERIDTSPQGTLGVGMSETGGVFTFPSTGYWMISAGGSVSLSGNSRYNALYIFVGGVDLAEGSDEITWDGAGSHGGNVYVTTMAHITNTSSQTVVFKEIVENGSATWNGSSTDNRVTFTFMKLGET